MTAELRTLHLVGAMGAPRTEMWQGREHLVVPMVALMEGVIHAVNSKTPEYVSADVLARSVGKWNGHPIVVGHPVSNGRQISAHDPAVLERHGCGFIRQSSLSGKRLGIEALIDPARLVALKQDQLLADLRAGKDVPVSVGAFVTTNDKKGSYLSKAYDGEWLEIGPDHTALLPGGVGACSLEMGCGANRAAMRVLEDSFEVLDNPEGINQYSSGGGRASETARRASEQAHASGTRADHQRAASAHYQAAAAHRTAGNLGRSEDHVLKGPEHADAAMKLYDGSTAIGRGGPPSSGSREPPDLSKHVGGGRRYSRKGLSMNLKDLKVRILALFDTPEQAASEEAAELVGYNVLRDHLDAMGKAWDSASSLVDELIADETETPTTTLAQEDAEEEVEAARLDALMSLLTAISSAAQLGMTQCMNLNMPDPPVYGSPRYNEMRAAIGKKISAATMKTVQAAHDASHDTHAATVALGAACNGMKLLAKGKDCPKCEGTGQVKDGEKQMDCPACEGEGITAAEATHQLRAACGRCETEGGMTKAERIAALLKNEHNPAKDVKALEGMSDDVLAIIEVQAANNAKYAMDLKLATDAEAKAKADLKAASEHVPTEEEYLKRAPASIQTLVAEKKAADAAEKTALVTQLTAASKVLTKEQLEAKPLDDLRTLAAFAKVDVDYSGRGVAVPRSAADAVDYTPPDPWAESLKALQAKVN